MKTLRSKREELERLGRALRTLGGSNRALLRAEDEASLLREVCRVVVEDGGYRAALVGRAEHDQAHSITLLAQRNLDEALDEVRALTWADTEQGRSATGTAIRTGAPCLLRSVQSDPFPAFWRRHGYTSVLALPLRVDGQVYGALTIAAPEPDAFDEHEREVLLGAADDLAFGLQTLRLRHRREQAEAEIRRLNRALHTRAAVNRALAHAPNEATLLDEICRVAVQDCGYRLAWVGYVEPDDDERAIRPVAYAGFDDGFLALPRTWMASPDARRIAAMIEVGHAAVLRDIVNDPGYPFRDEARQRGYASLVVLPLHVEGRLVGSLHILAAEADAFDDSEVELLRATAADLGYGIGTLRARARAAEAEATIRRLAWIDAVTQLPNRVRLRDLLTQAIEAATQERRPLALLRIELERFREINETLRDAEVDTLLQEVATRLASTVGEAGKVARLGESEFGVILPRAGADQASRLAQQVLAALYEPIELCGLLLDARSTVGISLFPGHGGDADALMRRASVALDQARRLGTQAALFRGGLDRECAEQLALMGELRGAIERDELLLYCQPKLALSSGEVCGAEALVRWQHPRRGAVEPGEFIKLAEHTGLITPLTYWMLDAALRQRYAWHEHGLDQPLAVNLSARDLRDPKLLERVGGALATWGAQPGWIEFELTESALMADPAGALETLTALKRLDVQLAIDDYGTGYSSLAYLQRLPVDALKIDRSFVADMMRNPDSAAIVHSTIELAHNLHLAVVAEGVEDQGTFDRLAELGCDVAQGYCISRPIPAEQFQGWRPPARH